MSDPQPTATSGAAAAAGTPGTAGAAGPVAPAGATTPAGPASPVAAGAVSPRSRSSVVLGYVVALALGGLVALVGTVAHRQWMPWVLVLALIAVLAAATMVRAWIGTGGLVAYGLGWLAVVQVAASAGPGGDVLLPGQVSSYVWMGGGMLMIGVAAFAPRRWFTD